MERLGENETEDDDGKQIGARLNVEIVPGWTASGRGPASGSASPGRRRRDVVRRVRARRDRREVRGAGLEGARPAQAGDNWDPDLGGGDESSFLALHGIVGYNFAIYQVPYLVAVEPILRLGWTDPETDVDDDEALLATPGLNVYFHPRVRTQVQADFLSPGEGEDEVAFRIHTVLEF